VSLLIAAFYRFAPIADPGGHQATLLRICRNQGIKGTILLAGEGINGTIAGEPDGVHRVLAHLRSLEGFSGLEHKESRAASQPFHRMKVRLKKEIVTLGVEGIDPNKRAGTYVAPREWNALISDPDVVVIDTRNDYEYAIGTFRHAVNPDTRSFREFPAFVQRQLDPGRHRRVAMFCTGGIRCEKATAYMLEQGFDEVYHLQGGILKYLEEVSEKDSLWHGECFVFDERVSVDHALLPGSHVLCHACRQPVSDQERASPDYEEGVSCPRCIGTLSERKLCAVSERQRQVRLANERGRTHIGDQAVSNRRQN
jgi:UPF0176 protein